MVVDDLSTTIDPWLLAPDNSKKRQGRHDDGPLGPSGAP